MRIELAVVEITNSCNLMCKHCYGHFNNKKNMELFEFEDIVQQLYNLGCTKIVISGGEPLIVGDKIYEYSKIVKKYNIPFLALTTNGTLDNISDYKILKLFDLIQVSIDGKEKQHNYIRGKGNYNKSINFIKKYNQKLSNFVIMMAVNKYNFHDILYVNDLSKSLNAKFALEIVTPCGRGTNIDVISDKEMKWLKQYIKDNKIDCSDPIKFCDNDDREYFNNSFSVGCSAGVSAVCIDSFLNVYPCARLRISIGNLKNKTLLECMDNEVIKKLKNRDLLEGKCSNCYNKYICGGCRARVYAKTGNFLEGDDDCVDYIKNK